MIEMSIQPDDWFNRFFGSGFPFGRKGRSSFFDEMFQGFDQMRRDMEREFGNMQNNAPKDLVREYETPEGGKVREVGPIVYGYSMTIGPDGKPRVKEFGNVKSPMSWGRGRGSSMISSEREPLSDISMTDKEVRVTVEMPGVAKDKVKINAYEDKVEVVSEDPKRKYHEVISIPSEADIETVKSTYNNGILEIVFKKKDQAKRKGKEIKVE
jgi:HSP20 family protein